MKWISRVYYKNMHYCRCFRQCYPSKRSQKRSQKYVLELIIKLFAFLKHLPRNPWFYWVFWDIGEYLGTSQIFVLLHSGRRGRRFKSCRIDFLQKTGNTEKIKVSGLFYFKKQLYLFRYFVWSGTFLCKCIGTICTLRTFPWRTDRELHLSACHNVCLFL